MLLMCLNLGADSEVRNFKCETPQQMAYLVGDLNENNKMVELCQKFGAGSYQLEYAETEQVSDWSEDDIDRNCVYQLQCAETVPECAEESMEVGNYNDNVIWQEFGDLSLT